MAALESVGSLRGHKAPVVSVCLASAGDVALTSSEDGTVRLWDLRSRRATRAVLAAAAAAAEPGSLGCCAFQRLAEPTSGVLVACGLRLCAFDLRGSDEILVRSPLASTATGSDEVNDFAVSPDGQTVAVPYDDGEVELLAANDLSSLRRLRGGHRNIAGVARFRSSGELLTGGFDEQIALWDASSGKLRSRLEVSELVPPDVDDESASGLQICNPPYVLSLAAGGPGDLVGVGLGSGAILALPGGPKRHRGPAPWFVRCAHAAATDCVAWLPGTALLASAGRDAALRLWHCGAAAGVKPGGRGKRGAGGYEGGGEVAGSGEAVAAAELQLPGKLNSLAASPDVLLAAGVEPEVTLLQLRK